jgi:hypothetical protein
LPSYFDNSPRLGPCPGWEECNASGRTRSSPACGGRSAARLRGRGRYLNLPRCVPVPELGRSGCLSEVHEKSESLRRGLLRFPWRRRAVAAPRPSLAAALRARCSRAARDDFLASPEAAGLRCGLPDGVGGNGGTHAAQCCASGSGGPIGKALSARCKLCKLRTSSSSEAAREACRSPPTWPTRASRSSCSSAAQ